MWAVSGRRSRRTTPRMDAYVAVQRQWAASVSGTGPRVTDAEWARLIERQDAVWAEMSYDEQNALAVRGEKERRHKVRSKLDDR